MKTRFITVFILLFIILICFFFIQLIKSGEHSFYRVQLDKGLNDKKNFFAEAGTGKIYFLNNKKKHPLNQAYTYNGCYFRLKGDKKIQIKLPGISCDVRLYSNIYFQGFYKKKIKFDLEYSRNGKTENIATIHKILNESIFLKDINLKGSDSLYFKFKGDGIVFFSAPIFYKVKNEEERNYLFLIGVDTLRADYVGLKVNGNSITPNIDRFMNDCVSFKNAYVQSPWTLPSFMCLFTSRYEYNHQLFRDSYLDLDKPFLINDMKEKFVTFSYNGGGYVSQEFGYSRGYDHYQSIHKLSVKGTSDSGKIMFNSAIDLINKTEFPDLFMFLHTYQLHQPYKPPEEFLLRINRDSKYRSLKTQRGPRTFAFEKDEELKRGFKELYQAEIFAFDSYFGDFIKKLREMNIYDCSMIVFMSDHGEEFYEHNGWEHGHGVYDEQIKVPLIIKFPDSEFRNTKIKERVEIIDIFPTIFEYYEIKYNRKKVDGKSLIPVIKNGEKREYTFSSLSNCWMLEQIPPKIVIFVDNHKIIVNYNYSKKDLDYFEEDPPVTGGIEVYDLKSDPGEKNNISREKEDLINRVRPLIIEIKKTIKSNFLNKDKNKIKIGEELKKQLETLGYL